MSAFQSPSHRLFLASGSGTRRALLEAAGLTVTARAVGVDEDALKQAAQADLMPPDEAALMLAEFKAKRIRDPDLVVIGADQLLVCEGDWFDKPADLAGARRHLERLRGRVHTLHTAVVVRRDGQTIWRHVSTPRLTMHPLSDAFLDAYLALEGTRLLDSVGAYRLEAAGIQLFDRIEGEHSAILGLPMIPLLGFLRQHGAVLG